jgi:2,4-dienoyl-CoA reductase-like NADH-dependent reductase (Old Yellow Enzyme family)
MPVAPSVVPFKGMAKTAEGFVDSGPFRALEIEEIRSILDDFRQAAQLALEAGFDGIELHGANGYLVDQFLQDGSNNRTDAYGGSMEKRARFLLEALGELIAVFGADRVGLRLSPNGQWGDVHDSDPTATFGWLAERLSNFGLAYLHVIDPRSKGDSTLHEGREAVAAAFIRKHYTGTIIAAGGFDGPEAEKIVDDGNADFVAFAGRSRLTSVRPFGAETSTAIPISRPIGRLPPYHSGIARRLPSAARAACNAACAAPSIRCRVPRKKESANVSYRRVRILRRARGPQI